MIISRFNKYVEKHGRVTYIVLGIIICFMFVIFVTPDGAAGGCMGGSQGVRSVGKMYGKSIKTEDFLKIRNQTDLACFLRYNMFLSQYNEEFLNRETLNRMRLVHEAKKRGYLKKVSDEEIAKTIHGFAWLHDDKGNFDMEKFTNFKNNFLESNGMTAKDFDSMIRENIAIDKMNEDITAGVSVSEAEIDAEVAEYSLTYADLDMDMDKANAPSDKDIQDFFDKRKSEIKADPLRSAIVASMSVDSITAAAAKADAPAPLKAAVTVTEADAKKQFEANKDRIYKGKTFESEKDKIIATMKANKIRVYTRKLVNDLLEQIKKNTASLDAKAALAQFETLAKGAKATVKTTGFFADGNTIPGMDGQHPQVANAIRGLNKAGQLTSNVLLDGNSFAIAILAEIKDGVLPEKLDASISKKISDLIISEKAAAFYNEKVAPFKAIAPTTKNFWELSRSKIEELQADTSLDDAAKQAKMEEYSDFVRECIQPFYREEQRSFSVASFKPADFDASVTLSESDIEKGYEARKADYQKVEARLSQILIKVTAADKDDVKTAQKAKADAAYAKLLAGNDFAKLVTEYSEDDATKDKGGDTGLVNIDTLDSAVKAQVEKMAVNQLSPIISGTNGYYIFKLTEKTAPKTLADVRKELTGILTKEAAKKAAMAEAEKLAQAVAVEWGKEGHKAEQRLSILKSAVAGTKAGIAEVPLTVRYNYAAQDAAKDQALMTAVFNASIEEPFTAAVDGTDAAYVACLSEVKPAYIEEAKDRMPTLINVYKRQIANQKLLSDATAQVAKLNEALKAGTDLTKAAGETIFKAANGKISKKTVRDFKDFQVRNSNSMLDDLSKAAVKTVIAPQRSYTGYVLVYVSDKTVPSGDEAKAERDTTKEQLLNQKKGKVLSEFQQKIEKDSDTKDILPSLLGNGMR